MLNSSRKIKMSALILGSAFVTVVLFQNCAAEFDPDAYNVVEQSSTTPAPEVPAEPPPAPPPPVAPAPAPTPEPPPETPAPPPVVSEPAPPPLPAFKDYQGQIEAGNLCPDCAFENRSDTPFQTTCKTQRRFLINNTPESVNRRCQELGWDYGQVQQVYGGNEWCGYCNAATRTWNGTSWSFGSCVKSSVKVARCYRN